MYAVLVVSVEGVRGLVSTAYSRLLHDSVRDTVPLVTHGRKRYQGRGPWLVSRVFFSRRYVIRC
jgi:hypothetical protein